MNNYFELGKPLNVIWHFKRPDGEGYSLAGLQHELVCYNSRGRFVIADSVINVEDTGVLSFTLTEEMQTVEGAYSFHLSLLRHGTTVNTIVKNDAIVLSKNIINTNSLQEDEAVEVALFSVGEFELFRPTAPVAGSDGWWYFDGQPILDDNGNKIPINVTLTIDNDPDSPAYGTIVFDKDRDGNRELTFTGMTDTLIKVNNQGDEAERQGNVAEEQGNVAKAQGDEAERQGNVTEAQGNEAERQGNYAVEKGDEAVQIATEKGDQAISTANAASTYARQQGDNAVRIANTAAENANEKATLADQKATLADQKATLANEKAILADQKAAEAVAAKENADTATANANTATTNANNAATNANTAAQEARDGIAEMVTAVENAKDDIIKEVEEGKLAELEQKVIYDVSVNNDGATFASLSELLSSENLSTLIPTAVRCGGMSIRFIQGSIPNSDNKYIQARCMAQSFTTDVTQWQSVDDEPTAGSDNLVKSGGVVETYGDYLNDDNWLKVITDTNGAFVFGIKKNGEIEWAKGVPTPVQELIQNVLDGESGTLIDGINKVYAFLSGYSTSNTLNELLDEKVDEEDGKSLVNEDFAEGLSIINDDNNILVLTDSLGALLAKLKNDGTWYLPKIESPVINEILNRLGLDGRLSEVPITLMDGYLNNSYTTVNDNQSVHALINDVDNNYTYLFMVPPTLTTSFVGQSTMYDSVGIYVTSSSFSVRCPNGNIAFNLHRRFTYVDIDPAVQISLGSFEMGSFDGAGNDAINTKAVRCAKIFDIPKGKLRITFDDTQYYVVINTAIGMPAPTRNQTIYNSGIEVEHLGELIRVSLRYKDNSDADAALITAADNGAVTVERVANLDGTLSVETLTQEQVDYIKVYKFIPKSANEVVVAASNSNANDKAKADIVLNGTTDTRFLQALVSSFTDINIVLCNGNYSIAEKHYIKRSDQYACLSTFDANGLIPRSIGLYGTYENRKNNVALDVTDEVIAEFPANGENAIFLISRLYPVNQSKLDRSFTNTGITIKYIGLYGEFYTKKITGFDTVSASAARYQNVNVSGFKLFNTATFPTMPVGSVGIRTGRGSNNGVENYVKNCSAFHLERGFSICGEHYIIEDCLAHHCKWGFAFHDKPVGIGVEHPNVMIGCSVEGCYQLMLLTRQGAMSQEEYDAMDHNKGINTLICIGLSTEKSWAVPVDERVDPNVEERTTTLGIWEVIPGRYRGRIEGDDVTVMEGSCPDMTITSY